MSWLLDTNVICELRKKKRCNPHVADWFARVADEDVHLSVLVIGEIRRGIETVRARDATTAAALERWLHRIVTDYESRILPVDRPVAEEWGKMNASGAVPAIDGLLAATARVHGLTLVTRNLKDVRRTGVACLNPFEKQKAGEPE